ncbi:MAG: hypothetical protein JOZ05_13420, partial [Acetobacteraceae bacterium]|nr:hypothetical protein [Acetobacteraceae bacterium]
DSGGVAQLGSVLMSVGPGGNGIAVADVQSAVEIGTQGGAALGKITVDANRAIVGVGSLSAPSGTVNSGTIAAQGGTLSIGGGVSGSGQLQIAAGATLYLLSGTSTAPVVFSGSGATLEITRNLAGGLTESGAIYGFAPGEQIWFASGTTVTSVSYKASGSGGTLTLLNGGATVGTLGLVGDYSKYTFQLTPNAGYGWNIGLVQTGSGGTASGGDPGIDSFAWTAAGGSWNAAGNWQDTTTLASGVAVPGPNNAVLLKGPTGSSTQTIIGPGQSASLTVKGNTTLSGNFSTGSLSVGDRSAPSQLVLAPGTVLTAGNGTVGAGGISASSTGTRLSVSGLLTLGGPTSFGTSTVAAETLSLTSGATGQVGSLLMAPAPGGTNVSVDATSSLEIGSGHSASAGFITIDAGASLAGAGLVLAANGIANAGTISAQGGTLEIGGAVTGTGQMRIGDGATLYLYGGTSTAPVTFAGASGTLQLTLTAGNALTEAGQLNGFAPGDKLTFASSTPITAATYTAGANGTGTLTLTNGGVTLGQLAVTGDFSYEKFQVTTHGSYGTDVTLVPTFASPDPLFDPVYYLRSNPDVAAAGVDPYQHYMTVGWKEGRDPNPFFHTTYYLNQNPDVAAAGVNPLTQYEISGWKEGRDPSLGFSTKGYLQANPDVQAAGIDPLVHFLMAGEAEGRTAVAATPHAVGTPDPGVDYAYYYAQHPDVALAGIDASQHYHTVGEQLGYNPNPYFDTNYYLTQNPDVKAAGVDPLTHYETSGWKEGRTPSLTFSGTSYLAANPDVKASGLDPMLHYMLGGHAEGRTGVLSGAGTAPDPLVDVAYLGAQLGASLLPSGASGEAELTAIYDANWQKGLNPDAWFDTNYYLSHNPDVAASGVNPLLQYETVGWMQGRDPSAQFSTDKYLAAYSDVRNAHIDPLLDFLTTGQAAGRAAFHV